MARLSRPDFSLYYDDLGPRDAPAVVLTHSLLCDRTMFSHLAAALSERYRVLNVDLRGHGLSSSPTSPFTLEDLADDLLALVDSLGVERATFAGLSMGGMTSMRVALRAPERARALVLMDTSSEPEDPGKRREYLALARLVGAVGPLRAIEARVRPLFFSDGFARRRPDVVARVFRRVWEMDRGGMVRAVEAVATRTDISGAIASISAPTLVMVGTEDRATSVKRAERIAAEIRGAELVRVEGAGHLATVEQPEETTRVVTAFLDRALER